MTVRVPQGGVKAIQECPRDQAARACQLNSLDYFPYPSTIRSLTRLIGVVATRTSALILALCLVGAVGADRTPVAAAQAGDGWTMLFDGEILDNFTMTGNANWRVADGVAEADMPRGYLVSREAYTNFDLRMEVWTLPESNAGVMLRVQDPRAPALSNGYEVNINDQRTNQDGRTGSIVNIAKPLVQFDSGNKWVTVDISAMGPRMTVRLDGILTAEATDTTFASGQFALQAAGGEVKYRNVQIRVAP